MAKLLIKNIELLHTPNGEMQNIAVEDNKIVYVGKDVPADLLPTKSWTARASWLLPAWSIPTATFL